MRTVGNSVLVKGQCDQCTSVFSSKRKNCFKAFVFAVDRVYQRLTDINTKRIFKSFRGVVIMSAVVSVLSFCIGLTASYLVSTPVGASVVVVNLLVFLTCCLISKIKRSNARV